jgi:hypothetical protein
MKKFFFISFLVSLLSISNAQIKSINISADYSSALNKRLEITKANAVGALVLVKINLIDNLNINFTGGYKLYSLNEPDVLKSWNWDFWTNRYYPKIISDLNADPNLSVEIGAVQKMDLIPVILLFNYDVNLIEGLTISPSAGGGIYFYTRRMFATENWSKKFPQANYTLTYSYRNFAPDKKGNPLLTKAGIDITYNLLSYLDLTASTYYTMIFETKGKMGYDMFPFGSELSINLGLAFKY